MLYYRKYNLYYNLYYNYFVSTNNKVFKYFSYICCYIKNFEKMIYFQIFIFRFYNYYSKKIIEIS